MLPTVISEHERTFHLSWRLFRVSSSVTARYAVTVVRQWPLAQMCDKCSEDIGRILKPIKRMEG